MAKTVIGVNSPQAVQRYAAALFNGMVAESFVGQHLMENANVIGKSGQMANAPICMINDLTKVAGDQVSFDLYAQITGNPIYGDDKAENNVVDLTAYTDEIRINQVRLPVSGGGKMTQKRTLTDLRMTARVKLQEYFGQYFDQAAITTLSGARGISDDLHIPEGADSAVEGTLPYTGYDADHIRYGGLATSKASLTTADKFSLKLVDRVLARIKTTGGGANGKLKLACLKKGSDDAFVCLLSPLQEHDLRQNTNAGDWMDIQKAAAGATGNNSHLFKNTLGVYRGVHFRSHQHAVQFDDYGAGQNVRADRSVLMGRQALAVAFGTAGSKGLQADWVEQKTDFENNTEICGSMVFGMKLPQFDGSVVGSYALDTAVSTDI